MTLIRGRGVGIEVVFADRELDEALADLQARLDERPGFYRGTGATVVFGAAIPSSEQLAALSQTLDAGGITLQAFSGAPSVEALATAHGVSYVSAGNPPQELARRRALRPKRELQLSEAAKSLDADFAGARSDIARRRLRGDTSVPRVHPAPAVRAELTPAPALHVVEAAPGTLYHSGTLRGGQSLHQVGNIVVVGDVNPGAELVATGDILVFGRLAGVAHAGAQGDAGARIYALQLAATQLRIATTIAVDEGQRPASQEAEVAYVHEGRIAIVPFDKLGQVGVIQR